MPAPAAEVASVVVLVVAAVEQLLDEALARPDRADLRARVLAGEPVPEELRDAALGEVYAALLGDAPPLPGLPRVEPRLLGALHESLLALEPHWDPGRAGGRGGVRLVPAPRSRKASGSFYTPPEIVDVLLDQALELVLDEAESGAASRAGSPADAVARLLAVTVCDPACGAGHVLLAAARRIADRVDRLRGSGSALGEVVEHCVHGVDVDPLAVQLARGVLRLEAGARRVPHLRVGNALLGDAWDPAEPALPVPLVHGLSWVEEFPTVAARGGFDVVVGNPPWVAHAGRAAVPLPRASVARLVASNPAFAGYRTTHGAFVRRAAELLRVGGRLALVLPTSVADLDGYRPVRRAHDELAVVTGPLTSFGDGAFAGVFQPCMVLSSRRTTTRPPLGAAPAGPDEWELARDDLTAADRALLAHLTALPVLPPTLFTELGVQTTGATRALLRPVAEAGADDVAVLEGKDVSAFAVAAPRLALPAAVVGARLDRLRAVPVVVRQTARWPVAGRSGGHAFRNSLLAVRPDHTWSAEVLLALLNSSVCRWLHHHRFRDAREGMPQVKVGHLRRTPAPPQLDRAAVGRQVTGLAAGTTYDAELDRLVSDGYGLSAEQHLLVTSWMESVGGPP